MAIVVLDHFPFKFPVDNILFKTDTQILYKNTGTYASPVFQDLAGTQGGTEESSTPITDTSDNAITSGGLRFGNVITLPTVFKMYEITAVEWINGASISGNVIGGVCIIDTDPPVNEGILIIAQTLSATQTPASTLQKVSVLNTENPLAVRGGAKLIGFIMPDNASGTYRSLVLGGAQNIGVNLTYGGVPYAIPAAYVSSTIQFSVKIYFQGLF